MYSLNAMEVTLDKSICQMLTFEFSLSMLMFGLLNTFILIHICFKRHESDTAQHVRACTPTTEP